MARKNDLRAQRLNAVINSRSKKQEKSLLRSLLEVVTRLDAKFPGIKLHHTTSWRLKDVVEKLSREFPHVDFFYRFETSAMRPDGGILSLIDKTTETYPILITEKRNQGTNDLRALEGKTKQAKGNAIERLGKNVIGFRTAMKTESIFPFQIRSRSGFATNNGAG